MTGFSLTRGQGLLLVALLWLAGIAAVFGIAVTRPDPVVVTHWGSGHVARPTLLPAMAEQFNQAGHKVASGKPIAVRFVGYGSQEQADDLVSRVSRGVPLDAKRPDPTVVTPSAGHWLVSANHDAGRTVVDLDQTQSIAVAWTGIVTQREMAECLGWPGKQDVIGNGLALNTRHRIQIFFIGIGKDADMEVGRILAEATGAAFQGATEKDLATVLAEFGKYF